MKDKYIEDVRKEFYKKLKEWQAEDDKSISYHYPEIRLADWWLSKFQDYSNMLVAKVEKMKKDLEHTNMETDLYGRTGYNEAIGDIIKILKSQ